MSSEVANVLDPEEIQRILAGQGAIDNADEGFGSIRMKMSGNTFQTDDDVWVSNPKSGEAAFTARLMGPPKQYQAYWFDKADAEKAGRPDIADRFCKSYYDNPQEAREYGTNGASCRACPFKPFGGAGKSCSWRGDLLFQIIPEDGVLKGDEPLHELSLSTTGMIEFRGTKRAPMEGSVSAKNFQTQLAEYCIVHMDDLGVPEGTQQERVEKAIMVGLNALSEGLVAAEFRILTATNEERGQSWPVVSLTPVHVQAPEAQPAIEASSSEGSTADPAEGYDDLPF